jgi:hypothetical protein
VISYGYSAGGLYKPLRPISPAQNPEHSFAPSPDHPHSPPPEITVRNILNERAYFDSARVFYSQNTQNNIVRLTKDIASEIGRIEMGEVKSIELATTKPVEDIITGTIRIWAHSAKWMDMNPSDIPFIINPEPAAGVDDLAQVDIVHFESFPNPSFGKVTVSFTMPERVYANIEIYDALGRVVRIISDGIASPGFHSLEISGLAPGSYTIELNAPEIGVSEHRQIIVL